MLTNHHRVIIIGSGPAGFTAALYAARANLKPVVFEGIQPGGQLTITTEVENYPGFAKGIMGPELMDVFREQAQRFGAVSIYKNITKVDFSTRPFTMWADEEVYTADAVIVATGASAKLLDLPSEKEYMGYGVSACATCDGFFFKGLEVIVVGGGDTAIEEATFLTKFANKVTIVHRRETLRASKIMQDKARKNPKIAFVWDSVVDEIMGKQEKDRKMVTHVRLKNVKTGETTTMISDGVFMGIGHKPNTDFLIGKVDLYENGYIKTQPGTTRTSAEFVFACGDAMDHVYRQAITAAGTGCMAALDAERELTAKGLID